jgi:hypothetical protein
LIAEDDEVQTHLILIGHAGVGKTSVRKHLRNERIYTNESPTIVMESEFLYRESMEDNMPFKYIKDGLGSSAGRVFLTIWDTGGQPVFQDLLPCFARLKCMYGIVFRLPDIDSFPSIRPCDEYTSPFSNEDIVYRNLAYLQAYPCSMKKHFAPIHESSAVMSSVTNFPSAVVVGTFKNDASTLLADPESLLVVKKNELNKNLSEFIRTNHISVYPVPDTESNYIHEIDNTASGVKEDPGIGHLRDNLTRCAQESNTNISHEWKKFKAMLQRMCYTDSRYVNVGIISLNEVIEIGRRCDVNNPKSALRYFHELGVFMWYHLSKRATMNNCVVIGPKTLLKVLSKVFCFDPNSFNPGQKFLVTSEFFCALLKRKSCKIDGKWFIDFLEENFLSAEVQQDDCICYFLPSLLSTKPNYKDNLKDFNSIVSPLYIVPQSGYIATGMFTRLLTALAGVTCGSTAWTIPLTIGKLGDVCRNQFEFLVNDRVHIVLTEYSKYIRVDCVHICMDSMNEDIFCHIVSTLDVQLQRIVPRWLEEREFNITFECENEECDFSASRHFLTDKDILFQSESEAECSNGRKTSLKPAHVKWRYTKLSEGGK